MPPEMDLEAGADLDAEAEGLVDPAAVEGVELDPIFAADASALFPDWSDADYAALQRLIDSRVMPG